MSHSSRTAESDRIARLMLTVLFFALALGSGAAGAQPIDAAPRAAFPPTTAADETAPVAVPEPSEQAMQYCRSGNMLWLAEQAWSIAVLVLLLATGFSAALRNIARRFGRHWFFTVVIYFLLLTVITTIIDLPLS